MDAVHSDKWVPFRQIREAACFERAYKKSAVDPIVEYFAGKTELLAQKAAFLSQTNQCREPQKILAISFKTDSAQNLRERVEKRCGEDIKGRFVSMTYDAFAKSILDHFLCALPDDLRPDPDYLVDDFETIDAAFKTVG